MKTINELIRTIIDLRQNRSEQVTLLAVCPNSAAVLEAAVRSAAVNRMPMLFAATLNQVDTDGGYTGWTQEQFVRQMRAYARKYNWSGPLYPCLDHGGPWLKDRHTLEGLSLQETMQAVKRSLSACLQAGYQLLHIDPTVDRSRPAGEPLRIETVIERTVELVSYAEAERLRLGISPVAYEVGTEEVHGGMVDFSQFEQFINGLRGALNRSGLAHAWPCFVVAQVGTDLHTTYFDPQAARRLYEVVAPLGTLVKGHYTDWVENPGAYPQSGMGGANVGPEFTAEEFLALQDLEEKEQVLCRRRPGISPSNFMAVLEQAVVDSDRWRKWLQPDEKGLEFTALSPERRVWLAQTGARYIWTQPAVLNARQKLYENLSIVMSEPHAYVLERIERAIDKYAIRFNLFDSLTLFKERI
jgi:D-tagatose-1,6-bisphosphate aldolase subunit GatZ/KbaZ